MRKGFEGNGFWAIEVAKPGQYAITLRRWPQETGAAINEAFGSGKAIHANRARIKIGNVVSSAQIAAARLPFSSSSTYLVGRLACRLG